MISLLFSPFSDASVICSQGSVKLFQVLSVLNCETITTDPLSPLANMLDWLWLIVWRCAPVCTRFCISVDASVYLFLCEYLLHVMMSVWHRMFYGWVCLCLFSQRVFLSSVPVCLWHTHLITCLVNANRLYSVSPYFFLQALLPVSIKSALSKDISLICWYSNLYRQVFHCYYLLYKLKRR